MKNSKFWTGLTLGIGIATLFWSLAYSILIERIEDVHKKEIDYRIEKLIGKDGE